MKTLATLALLLALVFRAGAQVMATPAGTPGPWIGNARGLRESLRMDSTYSHSGQFIVFAANTAEVPRPAKPLADPRLISLEPRLLAVSCERIKLALNRTLGVTTPWRGKVFLYLRPARSADDPITMVAEKRPGGWMYQLQLPNCIERTRFVRTIVDVLLLEMANRSADTRSAEIPAWLAEGLCQELLASSEGELVLTPPTGTENGLTLSRQRWDVTDGKARPGMETRQLNPLAETQRVLRARPPLTYEQMSWPTSEQLSGEAGEVYRASAHLFVNQLLNLQNGSACLRGMLGQLPQYYNWQFAFLKGFGPHFQAALDVEKWWALQLVQFAGRDLMQCWTAEESWKKLDEIVRLQVSVRQTAGEMPLHTVVTLQTIIREWDMLRQWETLQKKLQDLNVLRLHVSPDLVMLVDDYREILLAYMQKRNIAAQLVPLKPAGRITDRTTEETIRQLDALDVRREAVRPAAPDAPVVAAGAG